MSLGVGKCIPWVEEKGLLPGLGPWRLEKSWGVGVAGRVGARKSGEGAGEWGLGDGAGLGSGFLSLCSLGSFDGAGLWGKGFLGTAFWTLGKCFCWGWGDAFFWNFISSCLTTGASTVEEADFTNSPISFRVDKIVPLSTPNFFANS